MSSEKRQRVRFTGKRTGLQAIAVKGIGVINVGDVIEVSEDEAERWTAELPMREGKFGSDFVKSGGAVDVDEEELGERILKQQDKIAAKTAEDDDALSASGINDELAHGVEEGHGTAEEDAAEQSADIADSEASDK